MSNPTISSVCNKAVERAIAFAKPHYKSFGKKHPNIKPFTDVAIAAADWTRKNINTTERIGLAAFGLGATNWLFWNACFSYWTPGLFTVVPLLVSGGCAVVAYNNNNAEQAEDDSQIEPQAFDVPTEEFEISADHEEPVEEPSDTEVDREDQLTPDQLFADRTRDAEIEEVDQEPIDTQTQSASVQLTQPIAVDPKRPDARQPQKQLDKPANLKPLKPVEPPLTRTVSIEPQTDKPVSQAKEDVSAASTLSPKDRAYIAKVEALRLELVKYKQLPAYDKEPASPMRTRMRALLAESKGLGHKTPPVLVGKANQIVININKMLEVKNISLLSTISTPLVLPKETQQKATLAPVSLPRAPSVTVTASKPKYAVTKADADTLLKEIQQNGMNDARAARYGSMISVQDLIAPDAVSVLAQIGAVHKQGKAAVKTDRALPTLLPSSVASRDKATDGKRSKIATAADTFSRSVDGLLSQAKPKTEKPVSASMPMQLDRSPTPDGDFDLDDLRIETEAESKERQNAQALRSEQEASLFSFWHS